MSRLRHLACATLGAVVTACRLGAGADTPGDPDEIREYAAEFDLDPDPAGVHKPGAKPGEPCEPGQFKCKNEDFLIGCNPATRAFIEYLCPIPFGDGCGGSSGAGGVAGNRCVSGLGCIYGTGRWPAGTAVEPSPAYLPNPSSVYCIYCGWPDGKVTCEPDYTFKPLAMRLGTPCERPGSAVCSLAARQRDFSRWVDPVYPAGGQIVCGDDGVWAWSGACGAAGCAPVDRSCLNCPVDGTRCVELVPAPDPRTLGDGDETDAGGEEGDESAEE